MSGPFHHFFYVYQSVLPVLQQQKLLNSRNCFTVLFISRRGPVVFFFLSQLRVLLFFLFFVHRSAADFFRFSNETHTFFLPPFCIGNEIKQQPRAKASVAAVSKKKKTTNGHTKGRRMYTYKRCRAIRVCVCVCVHLVCPAALRLRGRLEVNRQFSILPSEEKKKKKVLSSFFFFLIYSTERRSERPVFFKEKKKSNKNKQLNVKVRIEVNNILLSHSQCSSYQDA